MEDNSFSILSYNVLAEQLTNSRYFPDVDSAVLKWKSRHAQVLETLRSNAEVASIMCLCEVDFMMTSTPSRSRQFARKAGSNRDARITDSKGFGAARSELRNMLTSQNYGFVHSARPDGKPGGLVTGWKLDKWTAVAATTISLNDVGDALATCYPEAPVEKERARAVAARDNVALCIALHPTASEARRGRQGIVVVYTHLYWDPALDWLKAAQAQACRLAAAEFRAVVQGAYVASGGCDEWAWPVVLAGDLNSMLGSNALDALGVPLPRVMGEGEGESGEGVIAAAIGNMQVDAAEGGLAGAKKGNGGVTSDLVSMSRLIRAGLIKVGWEAGVVMWSPSRNSRGAVVGGMRWTVGAKGGGEGADAGALHAGAGGSEKTSADGASRETWEKAAGLGPHGNEGTKGTKGKSTTPDTAAASEPPARPARIAPADSDRIDVSDSELQASILDASCCRTAGMADAAIRMGVSLVVTAPYPHRDTRQAWFGRLAKQLALLPCAVEEYPILSSILRETQPREGSSREGSLDSNVPAASPAPSTSSSSPSSSPSLSSPCPPMSNVVFTCVAADRMDPPLRSAISPAALQGKPALLEAFHQVLIPVATAGGGVGGSAETETEAQTDMMVPSDAARSFAKGGPLPCVVPPMGLVQKGSRPETPGGPGYASTRRSRDRLFTTWVSRFHGNIDHVYIEGGEAGLEAVAASELPGVEWACAGTKSMPSAVQGSDHLPVLVRLRFRSTGAAAGKASSAGAAGAGGGD